MDQLRLELSERGTWLVNATTGDRVRVGSRAQHAEVLDALAQELVRAGVDLDTLPAHPAGAVAERNGVYGICTASGILFSRDPGPGVTRVFIRAPGA